MSAGASERVTQLLAAAEAGDDDARERLWALVYDELHAMARGLMARERGRVTLQTTVLVNEAYMRLVGGGPVRWLGRRHFFAAAAEAMRRICVDYARKRGSLKRGGGRRAVPLLESDRVEHCDPTDWLALDEALAWLDARDPRKAKIVMLRYFAGLSIDETAEVLGVSPRLVDKEWRFARAWLHRRLSGEDGWAPDTGSRG